MAGDLLDDYVVNLGNGGILIHSDLPFDVGQHLAFDVSFPGLVEPLELGGVVRWRREGAPGHGDLSLARVGVIGVELAFGSAGQRDAWEALVFELEQANARALAGPRVLRVLLVEDNEFVRQMLDYAIRRFQCEQHKDVRVEVTAVGSAREALELVERGSIDLAVIDHFLPGMTGCELVAHMRKCEAVADVPILVLSGGGDEVKRAASRAGADMYLEKPVLRQVLVETIGMLARFNATRGPRGPKAGAAK